ncbi:MAG: OmpA/MotB domain protein [Bacteroidetes bacterium]|jgi:outer membrane protein OmpA-like peptidoglycan-associated protein/tetratricopeptide (TPR) repeat protein|nr:OmpA/MotB domain protein [Bacteroidota bacterium]
MMKKIIFLFFCLVPGLFLAQSKKLWLKQADELYVKKDYASALVYYKKVLDDTSILNESVLPYETQLTNLKTKSFKDTAAVKVPKKADEKVSKYHYITHQIAMCYYFIHDYDNAVPQLMRSMNLGSYVDDKYYYAKALMNKQKYNEAMDTYEAYMMIKPVNDSLYNRAQHEIANCYYALDSANNMHKQIIVRMMDTLNFNRGTSNFAPVFWGSPTKLIFTSARMGGVLTNQEKQSPEESMYLCDLYWTEQHDGQWSKPHNFGRPLNSGFHDGAGAMDADEIMYFTRWNDINRNESAIHMARGKDNHFFEAQRLDQTINLPNYKSAHPFVTFDGTTMFFSSNIPGGLGGMDIWYTKLDEETGMPGPVHNLGAPINTPGDEVTPYFHVTSGTLFFSSNGHIGMGGLDIFKSHLNPDDSLYAIPVNVGQPINSSKDDAYYILERAQSKGYFASDRQDCVGGHCYDIYEFDNEKIEFDLSGHVYDFDSGDPIANALVTIKDVHGETEPLYLQTNDEGFYSTPLEPDKEYFLKAQKKSYLAAMANLATLGLTASQHFDQDFNLSKQPTGDVVIEGIEYDLNKTTLRPASKLVLDKVYDLLHLNDNLSMEINAHTDTRGNDKYNMKLSDGRAKSCVDYLVSKGIPKSRLIPVGYGETKPLISDEEIAKMATDEEKELAHQHNRRTAFRIIGETNLKIIQASGGVN